MKNIKILALGLVVLMTVGAFSACTPKDDNTTSVVNITSTKDATSAQGNESENISDTANTDSNSTGGVTTSVASDGNDSSSSGLVSRKPIDNSSAGSSKTSSEPISAKTIYAKDYGAKGDGKTDDGNAILRAITALKNLGNDSTLVFEKNKTYYYKDNHYTTKSTKSYSDRAVINLSGVENVTIKGDNSTIVIGNSYMYYVNLQGTTDVNLEGFNFDYSDYKPGFSSTVISVNSGEASAIVTADRDIHMETGAVVTPPYYGWFAITDDPTDRKHCYITKYEMNLTESLFKANLCFLIYSR